MYIHRLAENSLRALLKDKKVIILLGARQVGKTTLIETLVAGGKSLILSCDIEVDKAQLRAASTLSPKEAIKLLGSPSILIIDEAQNLPEIGKIVKGWYD